MKIVLNKCLGGFSLSEKAHEFLGPEWDGYGYNSGYEKRTDPKLIKCIETLGEACNTGFSDLKVIEIPDGISYYIDDYDGIERVIEIGHEW